MVDKHIINKESGTVESRRDDEPIRESDLLVNPPAVGDPPSITHVVRIVHGPVDAERRTGSDWSISIFNGCGVIDRQDLEDLIRSASLVLHAMNAEG